LIGGSLLDSTLTTWQCLVRRRSRSWDERRTFLNRKHAVYIGAAGTTTAFGLVRSIRRHWSDSVSVVVGDTNPPHLVGASKLADAAVQVPRVADPMFTDFLVDLIQRHGVDIYVPILDEEIVLAAKLQEANRLPASTVVCAPPARVGEICLDKLRTAAWLESRGFPTPKTVRARDARWKGEPLFAKERRGVGSRGARPIETEGELESLRQNPEFVIQERCTLPEVTVDCYRSADDQVFAGLCRERLEVKAGVCTKARVFVDEELIELGRSIGRELPLVGGYCFQVMRPRDRRGWTVTDVNPRTGAGTALSAAVGFDPGAAMLAAAMGLEPSTHLKPPESEQFVVRTYDEWVM
jgi:carbamoylphosphate synthase large subunit